MPGVDEDGSLVLLSRYARVVWFNEIMFIAVGGYSVKKSAANENPNQLILRSSPRLTRCIKSFGAMTAHPR